MTQNTNNKRLSHEQLTSISERSALATAGPWNYLTTLNTVVSVGALEVIAKEIPHDYDGIFIEKARQDIPALLAEVERLTEALRSIDCHLRSAKDPSHHIIRTLKKTLPEYSE